MTTSFQQQMDELNRLLLQMATSAEDMVEKAIDALKNQNTNRAQLVIHRDKDVDQQEVEIDLHIMKILALQQPVAADLRLLLAAQKINNDLERVADHAVNIAETALVLAGVPYATPLVNIPKMADIAGEMLKEAIDSFVYRDVERAKAVKRRDDEIDELHKRVRSKVSQLVKDHPLALEQALHLNSASVDLERIADLATNIAEEVIFITEAEVVKHKVV